MFQLDPQRLKRVHFVNVRMTRSGDFTVHLSDGSVVTWTEWITSVCEDIRKFELPQ